MLLLNLFKYCPGKMFRVLHYGIVVYKGRKVHEKEILEFVCFLVLVVVLFQNHQFVNTESTNS